MMPDILPTIAEDRLSNFGSADDDEDEEAKVFFNLLYSIL